MVLLFVLYDPRLHQLFQRGGWQGLVHREPDGAFGCLVVLELFLNATITGGLMGNKLQWFENAPNPSSDPLYLKVGIDGFRGLRRDGGPNRRVNPFQ